MINKYDNERYRVDDIQRKDFKICQEVDGFCFGVDSVIVSDFAIKKLKNNSNVIDLCCGNGIIPILLFSRNDTLKITGVEVLREVAQLAVYNINLNSISDSVNVVCSDVNDLPESYNNSFDALTVNPPYIKVGDGKLSDNEKLSVSRHEILLSLESLMRHSSRLLKDKGKFFMIHRAHRIAEIIAKMKQFSLEPKSLRFVYPRAASQKAVMVLIYAIKGANEWVDVEPPLYIHENDGYTQEIYEIYGMENED